MPAHPTRCHAGPGDWLDVHQIGGGAPRRGQVLEVLGRPGHEHYRVRWDEQHESLHFPADGTVVTRRADHEGSEANEEASPMSTTNPQALRPLAVPPRTVGDVMHSEATSVPARADLSVLARTLEEQGVHTLVVADGAPNEGRGRPVWGIVTDVEVVPESSLAEAAHLMAEHGLSQLVVVASPGGEAVGIVSRRDVAEAIEMGAD
jgi:CBS domain-containing protein